MGLFGLALFNTEQRTREIGVRKVFGSSVSGVIFLISGKFSRWVLLANILAWPLAWWISHQWLQGFAYRINVSILPFIIAGAIAFIISLMVISYQTVKAARSNPVEALRYE
jgi:putative ABC transport system permease protein